MSEAIRTEIFASAAVSAAGNTAGFSIPTASSLVIGIDITAWATAGPVFYFQISDDGGTTWFDHPIDLTMVTGGAVLANQASITSSAIQKWVMCLKNVATDRFRLRWTVASGSATFSASVVAK